MLPQAALDTLAQGVARQIHLDTGILVGYVAKPDPHGPRVQFTFRVGAELYSHQVVSLDDLKRAHSWQGLFETMVKKALEDTAPWALAKKLAQQQSGEAEVPVVVDAQGRRHHTLKAETGFLGAALIAPLPKE